MKVVDNNMLSVELWPNIWDFHLRPFIHIGPVVIFLYLWPIKRLAYRILVAGIMRFRWVREQYEAYQQKAWANDHAAASAGEWLSWKIKGNQEHE